MKFLDPPLPLDPAKPFYPLIVGFLAEFHGYIELASRGIKAELEKYPSTKLPGLLQTVEDSDTRERMRSIATESRTSLIATQHLQSRAGAPLRVNTEELAQETFHSFQSVFLFANRQAAGSLIILAWELTGRYHTAHPLWQFLRHCRNAAAHNGRFTFRGDEPKHPAVWRSLKISRGLQNEPLFPDEVNAGFLSPGDVLHLLSDIELAFPDLAVGGETEA